MTSPRVLTVFGATGNQGGSVIDVILAQPVLRKKYKLRGITRNVTSASARVLTEKGVEMIAANLNDPESLRNALRGSHSVFGVTNFWDKDVLSKDIEIRQGINIFEACQAENVVHYVYSTLPHASRLTDGELQYIDHFDGKAVVAEHIESQRKEMITSYFLPAMYLKSYKDQIMMSNGVAQMTMPLGQRKGSGGMWPILDARSDSGKYIVGLLEGGESANGARAHGVSAWTSQQELLMKINDISGSDVRYREMAVDELRELLPPALAQEIVQTMQLVIDYEYYGVGESEKQAAHDKWLYNQEQTMGLKDLVQSGSPWNLQQ